MIRRLITSCLCLGWCSIASAQCVKIDQTGWTQDQINATYYTSYRLVFEAGQPIEPKVSGDLVCVEGFVGNLEKTITAQKILDIYEADKLKNEQALVEKQVAEVELTTLKFDLEQDYADFKTKTDDEKLAIVEKLLRIEVLEEFIKF